MSNEYEDDLAMVVDVDEHNGQLSEVGMRNGYDKTHYNHAHTFTYSYSHAKKSTQQHRPKSIRSI